MLRLIGISGKARHGKDSLADDICFWHRFQKISLATAVKETVQKEYVDNGILVQDDLDKKTPLGRSALQTVGALHREQDEDYWIKKALLGPHMGEILLNYAGIVVPDVRYLNEANWILDHGGKIIRVVKFNSTCDLEGERALHPSETEMDNFPLWGICVAAPEGRPSLLYESTKHWLLSHGI